MSDRNHVVYWIYNDSCNDLLNDGYVGVTQYPKRRLQEHIIKSRVPANSEMKILLLGKKKYCLGVEKSLRPSSDIGWNIARGGGCGLRKEYNTLSEDTKEKISRILKVKNEHLDWEQKSCEHCGVDCNAGTYARWHGSNCKLITGRTRPNYNSKEYKEDRAIRLSKSGKG